MNFSESLAAMSPGWRLYFDVLFFFWGACWGSFLNVCIYRIPRELSVIRPRSHCPHCAAPIAWYDNIPLISFFALRARCRLCGGPIAPRYVLVELLTAVLFLAVWLKFNPAGTPVLGLAPATRLVLVPIYWLAVFGLILGTFVDFEHMIIPDRVTLGGIVLGLLLSALAPELHFPQGGGQVTWLQGLTQALIGLAVGSGALYAVALIGRLIFKRDAMGLGDVKLLGAIGAFLGWRAVLCTIVLSSLAGSVVGVTLIALGKKRLQSKIPYGPYIALAALFWILWGPALWDAYLGLLRPVR